ncbi:MAG: acetate--CoA ligase family protein, partial [Gammaproteobacteria bacterium]|nr:acetate--CoA ligase family protein [Gammaproteobacteria bacterium]
MSIRNLQYLFAPQSVAVIGASNRPHSVGAAVMRNLLSGGFQGPIMPVNPRHRSVAGVLTYADVESLPVTPDLAVICTPARAVPQLVAALGARGTRAVVVLSAGLGDQRCDDGRDLEQAMLDAARPHVLRILGPNCLGLIVPSLGLNASFAHIGAEHGRVALLHQSGALCTALLDWARTNGIGFSHFVSLGDSADVDFGDLLDYLGGDPDAQAILMYVESIKHARKFMSAARAAARNKPVVVVKAGRVEEGARAAASHTGALAGSDEVYDAALRRAGMLRVFDTGEMFDAVETLSRSHGIEGERLAILTNGGGPGVIAIDALVLAGGVPAHLDSDTLAKLDALLPTTWSRGNPVDIIGDADGARYAAALQVLMDAPEIDAVLVMHAPTAVVDSVDAARRVAEVAAGRERTRTLLASWLGGESMQAPRRVLSDAGIPHYETPDNAVRAFMHLVRYRRNQQMLMETPASIPDTFEPVTASARYIVESALGAGRELLSEPEAKAVLAAYGIPVVETRIAKSPDDVARLAAQFAEPVAVKVLSESITHKSDVGGVVLDLDTPEKAREAAVQMYARIAQIRPDAELAGFTVQPMARRPGAYELIVGAMTDPIFGPALLFGEGGTAVE